MRMNDLKKSSQDFVGREKFVFDLFLKLNNTNKHKMIPIPICKIPKNILN